MTHTPPKNRLEHQSHRCTIFPHIPKCSGTSLKTQLEKSGLNTYFDYDKPPHNDSFFKKACEERNREASFLDFHKFDIVFGHFPIERYNKENYQRVTLLRHPVDRAISQYFYWKNVLPEHNMMAKHRNPIISDIKNGKVNFTEFLNRQNMATFYLNYLGNMQPNAFDLVGFTENYDFFLHQLSIMLNIKLSPSIKLRQSIKEELSKNELTQAHIILKEDIKRYEAFYRFWT